MRTTLLSILASLVLAVALAGHASAGDNPYAPGGITVWTPDDWTTAANGDDKGALLMSRNADNTAGIVATVTDAKDAKKAQKLLKKLFKPVLSPPKLDKGAVVEINGMKGYMFKGKAKAKATGKKVGLMVLALETPTHKLLLFVALADEASFAANKDTLVQIVQGIKPLAQ